MIETTHMGARTDEQDCKLRERLAVSAEPLRLVDLEVPVGRFAKRGPGGCAGVLIALVIVERAPHRAPGGRDGRVIHGSRDGEGGRGKGRKAPEAILLVGEWNCGRRRNSHTNPKR
jgi:hypothetical protein